MIQLPKDAEGREIPLDTKVLYGSGGTARNIVYWVYTVDSDLEKEWGNCWRAVTDAGRKLDPELMYLTEPDSWEKLEEDLNRAAKRDGITSQCRYFNTTNKCVNCPIHNDFGGCAHKDARAFEDILNRIRKLRGEGDA